MIAAATAMLRLLGHLGHAQHTTCIPPLLLCWRDTHHIHATMTVAVPSVQHEVCGPTTMTPIRWKHKARRLHVVRNTCLSQHRRKRQLHLLVAVNEAGLPSNSRVEEGVVPIHVHGSWAAKTTLST